MPRWAEVKRPPGERENLLAVFLVLLEPLHTSELMSVYQKDHIACCVLEERAESLGVNTPRPPKQLFGSHSREEIEMNVAESKLYMMDIEVLIEEKLAKSKKR